MQIFLQQKLHAPCSSAVEAIQNVIDVLIIIIAAAAPARQTDLARQKDILQLLCVITVIGIIV